MMKRIHLLIMICAAMSLRPVMGPAADKMRYNDDGTIEISGPSAKSGKISMDGKTPYGDVIAEVRDTVGKKDFILEIVYSPALSDDILEGNMKLFYQELRASLQNWINNSNPAEDSMRLVISNCRFSRTGYCRRNRKSGIAMALYRGEKKLKELNIRYEDILNREKIRALALKAVDDIMK
jgi:hypothetical protein